MSDQAEMEAARSDGEGSVAVSAKLGQFSTDDDEVQSPSIGYGDAFPSDEKRGFFIFLFFVFVFYKNIFSFSKFTKIYPGRPAAGRQGLICKKFRKKIAFQTQRSRVTCFYWVLRSWPRE